MSKIIEAIIQLLDSEDSAGCTSDLTVVSSKAIGKLRKELKIYQKKGNNHV